MEQLVDFYGSDSLERHETNPTGSFCPAYSRGLASVGGGGLHAILPYRGRCPKTNRLLSQEAVRKAKLPCYMQPVLPRYA